MSPETSKPGLKGEGGEDDGGRRGAWEGRRERVRLDSIREKEGAGETAEMAKKTKLFLQRCALRLHRVINI